jgi:drug/metabolite transporter (DMT)-like permease
VGAAALTISTALLAIPAVLTAEPTWPAPDVLAALVTLGFACTGLAFWCFYALIGTVGATRAAVSIYLTPAVALACGVALLDEPFTASTGAGLALILIGSWLSTRPRLSSSPADR